MDKFELNDIKRIVPLLDYYFDEVSLQPAISSCRFGKAGDSMVLRIPAELRESLLGAGKISDHLFDIQKRGKMKAFVFGGEESDYLILKIKKDVKK